MEKRQIISKRVSGKYNGKITYTYIMKCVVCGNEFEIGQCFLKRGSGYTCNVKCRAIRNGKLIKGRKTSQETKNKMKLAHSKRILWNKGKKMSKEHCDKLSKAHKGQIPWMKGKKHTKETIEKIKKAVIGKSAKYWLGKKRSKEDRLKMSNSHNGIPLYHKRGKNSNFWKGGITIISKKIKQLLQYRHWRTSVFERDNYTCQKCKQKSGNLEAHHIKAFSLILKENNIKTLDDARNCNELWDINNGQTLCKDCHKLTDNYGGNKK